MKAVETPAQNNKVASGEKSLKARKPPSPDETQSTRLGNELSRQQRELPCTRDAKNHVFDVPRRHESLTDLFDGLSQVIGYQFMFGPESEEGCPSSSSCPIILTAPLFI